MRLFLRSLMLYPLNNMLLRSMSSTQLPFPQRMAANRYTAAVLQNILQKLALLKAPPDAGSETYSTEQRQQKSVFGHLLVKILPQFHSIVNDMNSWHWDC